MFGKELAHNESYYKEYGEYKLSSSYTVYEAYIEEMHDKDGNLVKNKDGSQRYYYVEDKEVITIKEDKLVKEIREGLYKDVYQVNGDYVEKVDRDNKRIYYVVEASKIKTLEAGSKVTVKNGLYRKLSTIGYVLVDDFDIENPKVVGVKKFLTDDHQKEAKEIVDKKVKRFSEDNQ